jgi:hypothetical protein
MVKLLGLYWLVVNQPIVVGAAMQQAGGQSK